MLTKKDIISELQKYSEEIGKTPGEKAFYENTNVGIWDRMKYWSNYGELVNQAGLTPNKFDNTQYSKEELCDIFIRTIREKGKWPTRGYLDVKHTNDSAFPSSATFYRKLGLTNTLAQTILDYINNRKGFEDVIKICNSVPEKNKKPDESTEEEGIISGFVYLGKQHGDYKIGKAKDINRRRDDITLLGSEPFELIHAIETDDMNGIEKYWHNRFKTKNLRGEWFKLNPTDTKAFKCWKRIA
ncbi:MAG: hypothetical protein UU32_C0032G0003 [Candidatus Woesebacteria bacterium GW2011_GWB1_41_10]|uniref:Uncharacterized protein n=1 Tax=Candidatus Woesebacteria bacterium GW2011_GWB1_41_10 TaxID=1618577 RepID=A0A0G0U9Z3_9BACT|nr:MAG: hypothetical protein UU32_C0032G0003 [Candidatus Woesebacteria bacterium GW2011_GWB1_41_10]